MRAESTHPTPHSADWPEIVAPNGWRLRVPPDAEHARLTELLSLLPRC